MALQPRRKRSGGVACTAAPRPGCQTVWDRSFTLMETYISWEIAGQMAYSVAE
jgi:hypothetical protein